ncbi:MAG: hypothetical protein ACOY99_05240 [Pseudomonadota bacterium]
MRTFRSIEIDYDVHRLIEFAREHITQSPNDVLRRLLGLEPAGVPAEDGEAKPPIAAARR